MKKLVYCGECHYVVQISGLPQDPLWEELQGEMSCVRCGAQHDPPIADVDTIIPNLTVSPDEMFRAQMGLGLPEEQACTIEVVSELLQQQPIRRVVGVNLRGVNRMVIDHLLLWDGSKVYFAASGGSEATIYRITRPISYTAKALKDG